MKLLPGIFYILHGFVHLLYMGHSLKYFELEQGFFWPDNSRLFGSVFGLKTKRLIAGVLCVIAATGFVISGICFFIGHHWTKIVVITAVIVSIVLYVAFWDGSRRKLHTQGGIAILINIVILIFTR